MRADKLTWAALLSFFALLWIPGGHTEFLVAHWMKVGTFAAPWLVLGYAAGRRKDNLRWADLQWSSTVLLVAYVAHQFEEHWVDVLGHTYAFYPYVNKLLQGVLRADSDVVVLSTTGIFVINTALVWLVGALAIVASPRHAFPGLAMAAIVIVNAVSHTIAGVGTMSYNPGLLTSVIVFIPLSVVVYRAFLLRRPEGRRLVVASLAWAFAAHVLMVGGTIAANGLHLIPETVYFAVLVGWSVLPTLLFRNERTSSSGPRTAARGILNVCTEIPWKHRCAGV